MNHLYMCYWSGQPCSCEDSERCQFDPFFDDPEFEASPEDLPVTGGSDD